MERSRVPISLVAIAAAAFTSAAPQRPSSNGATTQAVVLVLQRNNRLSVFDERTLTLLGWFVTDAMGDGLRARCTFFRAGS